MAYASTARINFQKDFFLRICKYNQTMNQTFTLLLDIWSAKLPDYWLMWFYVKAQQVHRQHAVFISKLHVTEGLATYSR